MKLTTKFIFLIASIIIVPLLLTMIISFIMFISLMQDIEIKQDNEIMHWVVSTLHKTRNIEDVYDMTKNIPQGIDIVVLDEQNKVLTSSISIVKKGMTYLPEDLLSKLSRDYPERSQTYDPFFITGKENAKLLMSISQDTHLLLRPFYLFRWVFILFFILLISSSVVGTMFLGSFRRSIMKLEEATKRVAKGDLDFCLKPQGKDEIASLTQSFDSMRAKLKEEYAKRSRFLMAVSHDLSTPLTSIKGYVEAIKDGLAENTIDLTQYLSIISGRVDMLETRINELIEFVRMETGEWKLKLQEVRLKDFIHLAVTIYKEDAMIFKRGFDYTIDIPDNINVSIDQNLCLRALENLFHNAIRYTKENEEIRFKAVQKDKEIHLIIHDHGEGIPQKDLNHIFDPFFQGNKLNNQKGFGLGLSIVKSIISAHGWDIHVESEVGKGTLFFIAVKDYTCVNV